MYAQLDNVLEGMIRSVRQATQTNLKLQQGMLHGWSRLWPGFSGRQSGVADTCKQLQGEWSGAVLDAARAQRDLLDNQFDAAIGAFEVAMGITKQEEAQEDEKMTIAKEPVAKAPPQPVKPEPQVPAQVQVPSVTPELPVGSGKNIYQKVAIVTGGASGIGEAVSRELAVRGARAVMLVDRSERVQEVAASINDTVGDCVAVAKVGDTTDEGFRKRVFNDATDEHGLVTICIPAAGITRDALSVRLDKETGKAIIYPVETFRQVAEVNLLAPIYWGIEMVARLAEDRRQRGIKRWEPEEKIQGVIVFLGSVSSQGNKGQISYAVCKAGLEGAAATLQKEAIFYGIRCGVIHPGFTDTPMVRALGEDYLNKYVLPYTQLRRLIHPEEIADAICFMISNSAVSGELWADAGWHPPA